MGDAAAILKLAERCEQAAPLQADGGYKLNGDIAKAFGWTYRYREGSHAWGWCRPGNDTHFDSYPPSFSTSLDAVLLLIRGNTEYPDHKTFLVDAAGQTSVRSIAAYVWNDMGKHSGTGRTPALAFCAAALRASAA